MQNQKYLLPIGFYDLLGDEAKINQQTIDILLQTFYDKKYQLVKTPLVEFEESLRAKESDWQKIDEQSFKTIDSFSGKTLVIRSDITPQIARLMATKLQNITTPIRLCYMGDVLKVKNSDLYADRQLTQVGVELIGDNSLNPNLDILEIIELTLGALKKIKLEKLIINFCYPQFLEILLEELKIENKRELKDAISRKNISLITKYGKNYSDNLIKLALENNNFSQIKTAISALPISSQTKNNLKNWEKTIEDVQKGCPEIKYSIDIFGDEEFLYHNQIGFTIFASGLSYPIARGGKYTINSKTPAIGATVYINNLRKILVS
jgi:ATP phosphoribosyltransferase regulatory subunit